MQNRTAMQVSALLMSVLSLGLAVMALQSGDNRKSVPSFGEGLQDDSTSSAAVNAARGESAEGEWTTVAGGTMTEVEITYDQCFGEQSLFDLLLDGWHELTESPDGTRRSGQ